MIAVYGRIGYAVITSTFAYSAAYAAAAHPFCRTRVPARPARNRSPSAVRMARLEPGRRPDARHARWSWRDTRPVRVN